jgi:hypothetical protein
MPALSKQADNSSCTFLPRFLYAKKIVYQKKALLQGFFELMRCKHNLLMNVNYQFVLMIFITFRWPF